MKLSQENYKRAKLQITALTSFSCLQLCTALPLSMIIKDCVQILQFSQIERNFFERYLDTREQGKHLLPPPSDVFCGVCLKHIIFANKTLVIAIGFSCQVTLSCSVSLSGATCRKQSLMYWVRCLRGTSSLTSSTWSSSLHPCPCRDMDRDCTAQSTLRGLALLTSVTQHCRASLRHFWSPQVVWESCSWVPSGAVLKMQIKPLSFIYKTVSSGQTHCLHDLRVQGFSHLSPTPRERAREKGGHSPKGHLAHFSFRLNSRKVGKLPGRDYPKEDGIILHIYHVRLTKWHQCFLSERYIF